MLSRSSRAVGVALLSASALSALSAHAQTAAPSTEITVDASKVVGSIKPLYGVNGAPDQSFLPPEPADSRRPPRQNVSKQYQEAGVNLVRTHDALGAADIDAHVGPLPALNDPFGGDSPAAARLIDLTVIFRDLSKDTSNPASYNFGPTDKLIKGIRAIDADVIFRLGRSGHTTALPPTDLAKYGEIIRHIVLHYNKGWARGYTNSVKYWEVWNEPDLGLIWWRGTPQQLHAFYGAAAKAVKAADPGTMVGGPALAMVNEPTEYKEGFLKYVKANHLPLDFFSWHWYAFDDQSPAGFAQIGQNMRTLLDSYGFNKTLNVLDEWNFDFQAFGKVTPMLRAAFVAATRVYMQDSPIDLDGFYRADGDLTEKPSKVGQALIATGKMRFTPLRLASTGADKTGLAVLAGKSQDGGRIQVLVTNYEIPADKRIPRKGEDVADVPGLFKIKLLPRTIVNYPARGAYSLKIAGVPEGKWKVERYRLDDKTDLILADTQMVTGPDASITGDIRAPMVDLLVLTRAN